MIIVQARVSFLTHTHTHTLRRADNVNNKFIHVYILKRIKNK